MSVYVGIDVHRKRSRVAVIDQDGGVPANRNVPNGVKPVMSVIGGLPSGTPAAFEAAFGWGWLVELLEDYGFVPHLVHPLQCEAIASARLNNDKVDAAILAQLLRADLLPEAWIGPPAVRQLRAMLRHRVQLVHFSEGGSTWYDTRVQTFKTILRFQEVPLDNLYAAFRKFLRDLVSSERSDILRILGTSGPVLAKLGGSAAVSAAISAINDTGQWFP
jgi:hypothetical protein